MDLTWLKNLAPTVASALGGPLAGLAVSAVGSAFGWSDATKEKVEDVLTAGQLSGEQLLQLKQAELALVQQERDLGFKFAELGVQDRASARDREAKVGDKTNRNLAYLIVGAFIALVGGTLLGYAKVESVLAGTLVGYLSAKAEQVLAYYFGSSLGSAEKTQLLAKAPAIVEGPKP